jgi:hypothetical protein
MNASRWLLGIVLTILLGVNTLVAQVKADSELTEIDKWTDTFDLENCGFVDVGQNRYFILQPGYRLVLKGAEDDNPITLLITVLDETEVVDGVITRVVEERESVNGELIEVSRNFFAFCQTYGSVFYFGEDVDVYENGKVVDHGGSWRAGEKGFRAGLMMPGQIVIGSSYYQEIAPGTAMDRAKIVDTDSTLQTPAGTFEHCLVTEETSALELGAREYKIYAPGIGLIKDGDLLLTESGTVDTGER